LLSLGFISFFIGFLFFVKGLPIESQVPILKETQFDGVIAYTGGKYRIGTAALIIKNGFKGPVLISGVYPGLDMSKVYQALELTKQQTQQINIDYSAVSTVGNVEQTLNWVKSNNLSKVLIITSYYHVPRTQLLLNNMADAKTQFVSYPVFSNNATISLLFSEYIKILLFKFNYIINISKQSQLQY
jgi:uncharacterized SAM-binding protein YcdF (DUF218 family)